MDSTTPSARPRTIAMPVQGAVKVESVEVDEDDWTAFEILNVRREGGMTLIVGRVDDQTDLVRVGVLRDLDTGSGVPGFLRAKPERKGIVDLTTLSELDPVVVDAYLDCHELDDLRQWSAALEGAPLDQNSIGWRMSFGRDRTRTGLRNQFTRPNWLGGRTWLCMAAVQGHPSALNNLASPKILNACGIAEEEQGGLRQRLYACATALERSRGMPAGTDRQEDLAEAVESVSLLSGRNGHQA